MMGIMRMVGPINPIPPIIPIPRRRSGCCRREATTRPCCPFRKRRWFTYEDYRQFMETRSPEVVANIAICLIHQTNYLIDQQLRRLEQEFLQQGGLRERMTRARVAYRNASQPRPPSAP